MTITEALAEIKTIGKRLQTKRQFVLTYLCQNESLRDPLEKEDGGARGAIQRERQAIDDLEQRIVDIRKAIARSNDQTTITIMSRTRTVTEWLAWRKDVAMASPTNEGTRAFLAAMRNRIAQARALASQNQRVEQRFGALQVHASAQQGEQKPSNINVFLDESKLAQESETFEETIGQLDGQLSLKNATTHIELK